MWNNFLSKIVFFRDNPKIVVVLSNNRKMVKEFISQIMSHSFEIDKEILFVDNIEKANLSQIEHLILNFDLMRDCPLLEGTVPPEQFKVLTFGFQWGADFQASDLNNLKGDSLSSVGTAPSQKYTNFKVRHHGSIVPFWLKNSLEQKEIYSVLPAIIIGIIFGLNLIEISEKLRPHRLEA